MYTNSTGDRNVAVGYEALYSFQVGADSFNSALGYQAGRGLSTGQLNTFLGGEAGKGVTTGASNVAVGVAAMAVGTSASNCVCVGKDAGVNITTGGGNTFVGEDAGDTATTGYANICIGEDSDVDSAGRVRAVVIGQAAGTIAQNNTFRAIGDSGCFNSANTSTWSTTSDERIKKNIVDHTKGLNIINEVKIRNFEYRTAEEITDSALAGKNVADIAVNKTGIQTGLIAQEIETVRPECVQVDDWGIKRVNRDELFWDMMKAIQELSAKVTALEAG